MGEVGVTVPFLVGALAVTSKKDGLGAQDIRALLQEIETQPVDGFVTEVRWCPNVQAPVLSVAIDSKALLFNSCFTSQAGKPTLGFSANIESKYGGLGCSGSEECLEALVQDAAPHVVAGNFDLPPLAVPLKPPLRNSSLIGRPASACLMKPMICSSMYLFSHVRHSPN